MKNLILASIISLIALTGNIKACNTGYSTSFSYGYSVVAIPVTYATFAIPVYTVPIAVSQQVVSVPQPTYSAPVTASQPQDPVTAVQPAVQVPVYSANYGYNAGFGVSSYGYGFRNFGSGFYGSSFHTGFHNGFGSGFSHTSFGNFGVVGGSSGVTATKTVKRTGLFGRSVTKQISISR